MINKKEEFDWIMVMAPFNEELPAKERTEIAIGLSELIMRIATHIICHTIVDNEELFKEERTAIAHAFLQRMTSTHMCNHKLTKEGLAYHYKGLTFQLHEEYKTMTLTRSVYEHLAMFFFLFEHPQSDMERSVVWNYWKINSKKNLLDYNADGDIDILKEQEKAKNDINTLREELLSMSLNNTCRRKLAEWTRLEKGPANGSIEFFLNDGNVDVRKVTYSQVWKYLFSNEEMTLLYRHLSIHCHPVYNGLVQYQSQSLTDRGEDALPLYLSCSFLACVCEMFLKQMHLSETVFQHEFNENELFAFHALSQVLNYSKEQH